MVGILLMTHAPLASAFLAAAAHVHRAVPQQIRALDVLPDQEPYEVNELAAQALREIDSGDGVLILTDVCGATPANCAQRLVAQHSNALVLFGLSVPMLLRAINYRDLPLAQVAQKALDGGTCGTMIYKNEEI